jgi:hypothetical protein
MANRSCAARDDDADCSAHLDALRAMVHGNWGQLRDRPIGEAFAEFVIRQQLAPYAVGRLEDRPGLLPAECLEKLRAEVAQQQGSRARLHEVLAEVARELSRANLGFRILKGIPFAERYFGNINLRKWVDVDLLVRLADVGRAVAFLRHLGFRCDAQHVRLTPQGLSLRPNVIRNEHGLAFFRDNSCLDLHWRLRAAPAYHWREADIWSRHEEVNVNGVTYPVLADEYALALALVSAAHDIGRGAGKLRHLLDAYAVMRHFSDSRQDWRGFLEQRHSDGTERVAACMLQLVEAVWAQEGEFAGLANALASGPVPKSAALSRPTALALVNRPRGSIENNLWFAAIYDMSLRRDAAWFLRRHLSRVGPLVLWRWLCHGCRMIRRWIHKATTA